MSNGLTVILAAGDFPRAGGEARKLLAEAERIIACDGAALALRRILKRDSDVIIGDLDSLRGAERRFPRSEVIRVSEQETNDLEKALLLARERGWRRLVIVGATGRREDHTLSNVFRALAYGVKTVTDRGVFHPVAGRRVLPAAKGAAVSVFAPDPATRVSSKGLAWPLDEVRFRNLYCAALNRATSTRIALEATRPISVFIGNE